MRCALEELPTALLREEENPLVTSGLAGMG